MGHQEATAFVSRRVAHTCPLRRWAPLSATLKCGEGLTASLGGRGPSGLGQSLVHEVPLCPEIPYSFCNKS